MGRGARALAVQNMPKVMGRPQRRLDPDSGGDWWKASDTGGEEVRGGGGNISEDKSAICRDPLLDGMSVVAPILTASLNHDSPQKT